MKDVVNYQGRGSVNLQIVEGPTWCTGGGTLFCDYEGYMSHAGLEGVG